MQNSPMSALPVVVAGKPQVMDSASTSVIPAAETTADVTFESLLAQQTQAQPVPQSDDLALFMVQQNVPKDQVGKEDSSAQEDASVMFTDLAALFATLIQAAVPIRPPEQAVATTKAGAEIAKSDEIGTGAKRGALSVAGNSLSTVDDTVLGRGAKPGKEAAEIAGTGKELPFVEARGNKEAQFNVEAKVNVETKINIAAFQPDELKVAQNATQVDAPHVEAFSQVTGVQGSSNEKGAVTVSVEPRVGAPGWDGALGQKVVWLVNQRHQTAEMQLNPPNLGPLEVKITITNDQASALFVSHHAAVRDAIETALPRLREMLAESGITLGNAQVSSESFPREQPNGEKRAESGWRPEVHDMAMPDVMGERMGVMRLHIPGSVDIFA